MKYVSRRSIIHNVSAKQERRGKSLSYVTLSVTIELCLPGDFQPIFQIHSKLVNKGLSFDEVQKAALKENIAVTPPAVKGRVT